MTQEELLLTEMLQVLKKQMRWSMNWINHDSQCVAKRKQTNDVFFIFPCLYTYSSHIKNASKTHFFMQLYALEVISEEYK